MRLVLLFLSLFAFWLVLSGVYKTWLIAAGAIISALTVLFVSRNRIADTESFPIEDLPRGLVYWPWLVWQMFLSALSVTRIVLDPRLPISPTMVSVESDAKGPVGLVTYANSITLTPGTLSVEVSQELGRVWVHAITRENAAGLADDPMNEKVAWMDEGTR